MHPQSKQCPECKNTLDLSAFGWDTEDNVCNGCWSFRHPKEPAEQPPTDTSWESFEEEFYKEFYPLDKTGILEDQFKNGLFWGKKETLD